MSPLRWDVLLVGFVLALPVLALGLRGDLTVEEVTTRLLWCLAAGWARRRAAAASPAPRGRRPGRSRAAARRRDAGVRGQRAHPRLTARWSRSAHCGVVRGSAASCRTQ